MLKLPIKTLCLCICFVEAAWLLLAQALGSMLLLLPCLVCFLVIMIWAALQNVAMPVFLFFLPFAPLLKMAPQTISFYTLALLTAYAIYAVKGYKNVRIVHIVPALLLIILTVTVKLLSGFPVTNEYVLFAVSLLLVPFLATELDDQFGRYDFYWVTLFFVLGIVMAAITSQLLANSASIARYINIVNELGIDRRTGYYNDPNFYSAHITAALGGVLVLLLKNTDRIKRIMLIGMAVLLFYCGLLSISKSFLLISVFLLFCWFLAFMFQKGRISAKILMIITLLVVMAFILSSTLFTNLLDLMLSRLSSGANLSDFTTRRVDLWANYMRVFRENPLVLLFGNGYSDVLVDGRGSHNTVIQVVYQLGLVGSGMLIAWFVCFMQTMLMDSGSNRLDWAQNAILLIGAFGPWMALDYLFFDEFFLIPLYLCVAIRFLTRSPDALPQPVTAEEG